jgi:ribose transport system permease protein
VNTFWYDVVGGVMLLVAVLLSRFISLRNARALLGLKQSKMDQLSGASKA